MSELNSMVVRKRGILIVLIFCITASFAEAQLWKIRRWEAKGGLGTTQFFGDVGGYTIGKNFFGLKDITYLQTRYSVSGSLKYRITRTINARVSLSFGKLHATDSRGSNEGRDLESTSSIFEPSILGEYYFFKNKSENSYIFLTRENRNISDILSSLDFYVFTGIGGCTFKVKGNEKLMNKPDFTNGGFTPVIPFGFGVNLIYSADFNFGIELGGRYAFTDFLDGYTNVQYSKANDVYYLFNLTATYKLRTKGNGFQVFRK